MLNKLKVFLILIVFVSLLSCSYFGVSRKGVLANVDGVELTEKQVKEVLGNNINLSDVNVKTYVNNWVRNQLVIQSADKLLSPSEKDFTEELNSYKTSLLRYSYESKYVNERIDTLVKDSEIEAYYKENSRNFELKESIVKVRMLRLFSNSKNLEKTKKLFLFKDSIGELNFDKWVKINRLNYLKYDSSWMSFDAVKSIVPLKLNNEASFLSNNKYTEVDDGDFVWLVYFSEYTLKDNISPLEAVKDKIKNILINKRKLTIVKEMEKELYEKAIKKGKVKLYLN